MGVINGGIVNNMGADKIPVGYVLPTVSNQFQDYIYSRTIDFFVTKSLLASNVNANETLAKIFTDSSVGIIAQLTTLVTNDFNPSSTWLCYGRLTGIKFNNEPSQANFVYLKAGDVVYQCSVTFYVKRNA